jgi:phage shock protein PspC (stress-responsive transcriptional regulator)
MSQLFAKFMQDDNNPRPRQFYACVATLGLGLVLTCVALATNVFIVDGVAEFPTGENGPKRWANYSYKVTLWRGCLNIPKMGVSRCTKLDLSRCTQSRKGFIAARATEISALVLTIAAIAVAYGWYRGTINRSLVVTVIVLTWLLYSIAWVVMSSVFQSYPMCFGVTGLDAIRPTGEDNRTWHGEGALGANFILTLFVWLTTPFAIKALFSTALHKQAAPLQDAVGDGEPDPELEGSHNRCIQPAAV